ncbi:MAG TPA: M20 family peptidase [Vicinamibacteria bacterium]|nr:M20 family peptidase [Vicinamibacteria bacterium]
MKAARLIVAAAAVVAVGAAVAVMRAVASTSRQVAAAPVEAVEVDPAAAAERLAGAIRIRTLSTEDPGQRPDAEFAALHAYLARSFPRAHATLAREAVGRDALLYTWAGTDPALAPIVLMGHMDVVPVEAAAETAWEHPPFGGDVAGGFVWGRGSLDDKVTVLGILEAVEALAAGGFRPRRTVLLAFGADEEVGGGEGAAEVARLLRERLVVPELVLDEGGAILHDAVPGVRAPVALIGIAEKGFASVELVAKSEGGHSMAPPPHTTVGVLARAIARLEERQFPAELRGATAALFDYVGPEMPFGMRLLFANRWLFGPLIERNLARNPSTNAAIRTTTAATVFEGGPRHNVLPSQARAVVNFRILPGDSVAAVRQHVRDVVNDPAVVVTVLDPATEPSPVSPTDSAAWMVLQRTTRQVFPDAVVAPYLVTGGTDARHFSGLTPNVYRFTPTRMTLPDLTRVHGTNERVSVSNYAEAVQFYAQLLRNVGVPGAEETRRAPPGQAERRPGS